MAGRKGLVELFHPGPHLHLACPTRAAIFQSLQLEAGRIVTHMKTPGQRRFATAWQHAVAVLTLCCHLVELRAQGTFQPLLITFDGSPLQPPGTSYSTQQYFESTMWFRPLGDVGPGNGFSRVGGSRAARPENGTAYIAAMLGDSLLFSFIDSSLFGLDSVDLAEYSTVVPDAVTVPFVGYHNDGSVVTVSFTTDGIIDGTGPLADFETFQFGPEWSGLTRVEISTWGWSLDNLVVSIPEPTTGALLFFVGGLIFCAKRYRKTR